MIRYPIFMTLEVLSNLSVCFPSSPKSPFSPHWKKILLKLLRCGFCWDWEFQADGTGKNFIDGFLLFDFIALLLFLHFTLSLAWFWVYCDSDRQPTTIEYGQGEDSFLIDSMKSLSKLKMGHCRYLEGRAEAYFYSNQLI